MSDSKYNQSQENNHTDKRILGENFDSWSQIIAPRSKYYDFFENIHDELSDNDYNVDDSYHVFCQLSK